MKHYANLLKIYNESELKNHLWELNCAIELDCYRNDFKKDNEPLTDDEFEKLCAVIYDYVMDYEHVTPIELVCNLSNGIKDDAFTLEDILEANDNVDDYLNNAVWEY